MVLSECLQSPDPPFPVRRTGTSTGTLGQGLRRGCAFVWPVRKGGWTLRLYENSLSIALLALFVFSFIMHAVGGASAYNQEQLEHGGTPVSVPGYLATPRFWFESFQNWQSEFLAIGAMIVLSIYLRQRSSSQSKPVASPHGKTGS